MINTIKTTMIELGEIKPNPFKQFIKKGKLDEEVISKLMEGYKQTTFHINFKARENAKGEAELIYGHHRLEAAIRTLGKKYKIKLDIYPLEEFSDENMLLDMIRENLTQRGDDYKDLADCIILTKRWLEGNRTVKLLDSSKKTHKKEVSLRDISNFLSNQGRSISYEQIKKHILIEDNLHPDLKEKIEISSGGGKISDNKIGFEVASYLAEFEKSEQKILHKQIEKGEMNRKKARTLLNEYKDASEEIKSEVKRGKVKLEDVSIEKFKEEIKEKADKSKGKDKGKAKVKELKKYIREGENLIGGTNAEIFKTCVFFEGLTKTGLIHNLDWNTIYDMLENAQKGGNQYVKFAKAIMEKI